MDSYCEKLIPFVNIQVNLATVRDWAINRFGHPALYDRREQVQKGHDFSVHVNGTLIMNDVFMLVNAAVDGAGLISTASYPLFGAVV